MGFCHRYVRIVITTAMLALVLAGYRSPSYAQTSAISTTPTGETGNGRSMAPSITADGRFVVFTSTSSNLYALDRNGVADVFLRDRISGTTIPVSRRGSGETARGASEAGIISADGSTVAFRTLATEFVPVTPPGGLMLWSRTTREFSAVTLPERYVDHSPDPFDHRPDPLQLSENGRYLLVRFTHIGTGYAHHEVFDRTTRVWRYIRGASGYECPGGVAMSGDGLTFTYWRVTAGTSGFWRVCALNVERSGRPLTIPHIVGGLVGDEPPDYLTYASLSRDGRFIAFEAHVPAESIDRAGQIFRLDTATGSTVMISQRAGVPSVHGSNFPAMSADGRFVAFNSPSSDLLPVSDESPYLEDEYVHDLTTGLHRVRRPQGRPGDSDRIAWQRTVSGNGRHLVFESFDPTLAPDDLNGVSDVFAMPLLVSSDRYEPNESLSTSGAITHLPLYEGSLCLPAPMPPHLYPDSGGRCRGIFEDADALPVLPPRSAAYRWRSHVNERLSLESTWDRDFFGPWPMPNPASHGETADIRPRAEILRDPTRPVPLPECATLTRLDPGGVPTNVTVSTRLEIVAIPTTFFGVPYPIDSLANELFIYNSVLGARMGASGPPLHKVLHCPRTAYGLSQFKWSVGERVAVRSMSIVGGYTWRVATTAQVYRGVAPWAITLARSLGMPTMLDIPCTTGPSAFDPGASFPTCAGNAGTNVIMELPHPMGPRAQACGAGDASCREPLLVQWPATTRPFDVQFDGQVGFDVQLLSMDGRLVGRGAPCLTCPTSGNRTAYRLNAGVISAGLYVLSVQGTPGSYGIRYVALPK